MIELYNRTPKNPPEKVNQPSFPFPVQSGGGAGAAVLPCLYSNNSIENNHSSSTDESRLAHIQALCGLLTPYHKRQAQTLYLNVERLINKEAISPNHVGFLTLTFADNITDHKEAYRRFRSFNTNFLSKHPEFGHWINTKEQQLKRALIQNDSGAWHFHLLVCLNQDIKTGVNFEELEKRRYTSASPYLRGLWQELREAMPKYGFGRSELQPIKSNAEAMGRYIGKYISKHIGQRNESSKGARLINYSKGWLKNSVNFAWNTDNAKLWRQKLRIFARQMGCQEQYQLTEKLGSDWAYRYSQDIFDIEIVPERFLEDVYGPEKVYQNKMLPEMEKKAEIRDRADWNKAAIENFDFEDSKRQAALKQKVAMRSADESRNKKKEKSKVKVQSLVNSGCKEFFDDPRMMEFFRQEAREEIESVDLKVAKIEKDRLHRLIRIKEGIKANKEAEKAKVEKEGGVWIEEVKEVGIIPF